MKHSLTFFTYIVHHLVNFASYKKNPIAALTLILKHIAYVFLLSSHTYSH